MVVGARVFVVVVVFLLIVYFFGSCWCGHWKPCSWLLLEEEACPASPGEELAVGACLSCLAPRDAREMRLGRCGSGDAEKKCESRAGDAAATSRAGDRGAISGRPLENLQAFSNARRRA